jgi:hypothetical protein
MSLDSPDLTVNFVRRALDIDETAGLRVKKEGLFQPPEEVVEAYTRIFRERGMNVLIDCMEDPEDPKKYFNLIIKYRIQ